MLRLVVWLVANPQPCQHPSVVVSVSKSIISHKEDSITVLDTLQDRLLKFFFLGYGFPSIWPTKLVCTQAKQPHRVDLRRSRVLLDHNGVTVHNVAERGNRYTTGYVSVLVKRSAQAVPSPR